MEEESVKYYPHRKPGVVFGCLLVLVGIVFFAFNSGLWDEAWKQVVFSWQALLFALGCLSLAYRHWVNGLMAIVLGSFFALPRLSVVLPEAFGWVSDDFTDTYWPVLLMALGVLVLFRVQFPQRVRPCWYAGLPGKEDCRKGRRRRPEGEEHSRFDRNCVFGNVSEVILDPVFTGGEMRVAFGNLMLDLRRTTIPEGETVIELNVAFGGVTIFVPADWEVVLRPNCVFGGFGDSRMLMAEPDHGRRLLIYGACVFGGGELKN